MAKRFTDTEKWRNPWFRKLPARMKLLWGYICDTCDAAGIWYEDLEGASFAIGEEITREDYARTFGEKLIRLKEDKVFFPQFIEFQYEKLSSRCPPHQKVIHALQKHGIDPESLTLLGASPSPVPDPAPIPTLPGTLPPRVPSTLEEEEEREEERKEEEERGYGGKRTVCPTAPASLGAPADWPERPDPPPPVVRAHPPESWQPPPPGVKQFFRDSGLLKLVPPGGAA